jgi:hypothetical protein
MPGEAHDYDGGLVAPPRKGIRGANDAPRFESQGRQNAGAIESGALALLASRAEARPLHKFNIRQEGAWRPGTRPYLGKGGARAKSRSLATLGMTQAWRDKLAATKVQQSGGGSCHSPLCLPIE